MDAGDAGHVDWRPYRVVGAVLALALALNLWAGNGLWLSYTMIGSSAFCVLIGLVRVRRWRFPPAALWTGGLAAGLHYVGGSLSGLHQFGGPNGLYYVFPWWDTVVHTLGAGAVAVAASAVLAARVPALPRFATGFLAVCIATSFGVLVELYEFAGFAFFGTIDQGYYTNNLLDLYYNLLGAVAFATIYARLARASPAPISPSETPV